MDEASKPASQRMSFGKAALCIALGTVLSAGLYGALLVVANLLYVAHASAPAAGALGYVDAMFILDGLPLAGLLGLVASLVAVSRSKRPLLVSTLAGAGMGIGVGAMVYAVAVWNWCGPAGMFC